MGLYEFFESGGVRKVGFIIILAGIIAYYQGYIPMGVVGFEVGLILLVFGSFAFRILPVVGIIVGATLYYFGFTYAGIAVFVIGLFFILEFM